MGYLTRLRRFVPVSCHLCPVNVTVHQHTLSHSWDELFLDTQPWACVTCLRLFFAHMPDILEFSSYCTGHPLPQDSHHCCFLDCTTSSHLYLTPPSIFQQRDDFSISLSHWPPDRVNYWLLSSLVRLRSCSRSRNLVTLFGSLPPVHQVHVVLA